MLILLTNDDGIHSEGLLSLRERLSRGHQVYVVAPEKERTCIGHAITLHKPLRIKELEKNLYASNGTPADCVLLGLEILIPGRPDLIISGINKGPNMGQDVNYSGTVAAAKEAALSGIASIAVSIAARDNLLFHDAIEVTLKLLEPLCGIDTPSDIFFNINIPNIPIFDIKGFMVTRLGKRIYNNTVFERVDPRGGRYYWIAGDDKAYIPEEGTDLHAVDEGYVSITPMGLDMTKRELIEKYQKYLRRCV